MSDGCLFLFILFSLSTNIFPINLLEKTKKVWIHKREDYIISL